jgi:hypothetical protein
MTVMWFDHRLFQAELELVDTGAPNADRRPVQCRVTGPARCDRLHD